MNRRDFLKKIGVGAFAGIFIPGFIKGERHEQYPQEQSPEQELNPREFVQRYVDDFQQWMEDKKVTHEGLGIAASLVHGDGQQAQGMWKETLHRVELAYYAEGQFVPPKPESIVLDPPHESDGSSPGEIEKYNYSPSIMIPEALWMVARTGDDQARIRSRELIEEILEHNAGSGVHKTSRGAIFHHVRPRIVGTSASSRHRGRITAARQNTLHGLMSLDSLTTEEAATRDALQPHHGAMEKSEIGRVYPMDQWFRILDYTSGLHAVWDMLDEVKKNANLAVLEDCVKFWQDERKEFHGFFGRFYTLAGERINDTVAPDDTLANPVSCMTEMAVMLREMGACALADMLEDMARGILFDMDRVFWVEEEADTGSGERLGRIAGRTPMDKAEDAAGAGASRDAIYRAARERISTDLPADGTRVALARRICTYDAAFG